MLKALKYYGGKLSQLDYILPMIPPHVCYVEPYGGSAAVLLNKDKSEVEVYNDLDSAVVIFFRVLREKPKELINYLNLLPYSREEFEYAKQVVSGFSNSDIEKAAYYYLLSEGSISCNKAQWSYGRNRNRVSTYFNSIDNLMPSVERIRDCIIEHKEAADVIQRYDSEDTFFYIDPPYMQSERSDKRYKIDYTELEHLELLMLLAKVKGMVLLSGYDNGLYRKRLKKWHKKQYTMYCKAVGHTRSNNIMGEGVLENHKRIETLWYNYDEPERSLF